ncbi:MAG: glycosyltransferase family 4 protein [Candidatus Eremiobacteraeota bacterium]|nr:glycosyltransferase family 4 protein [Candidatus Eremiobacteraeota bacterium]
MTLCIVSAKYPYGLGEAFLDTELRALAPGVGRIVVFPTSPKAAAVGYAGVPAEVVRIALAGPATLWLAARAVMRNPRRALGAVATLLRERYPLRAKVKNLAVIPKGLALAELARARNVAHVHAYWLSTPATLAWLAARVAGLPFSATTHRWDLYENNMAARKLQDASFIRTISERGRDDLLRLTGGDPAKAILIRLGIALPAAAPARVGASGALRILCAARLVPVKGHTVLIEALGRLRERGVAFTCTLAGEGELREALARQIAGAGLHDVVAFAGVIHHGDLLARLQRGEYDVSVIASIERPGGLMEGVPVALIEAMAAGVTVVATDSGSVRELVDGTNGLLVPQSDAGALATALERVAMDPPLRERLRDAGWVRVKREFDGELTAARLLSLLTV